MTRRYVTCVRAIWAKNNLSSWSRSYEIVKVKFKSIVASGRTEIRRSQMSLFQFPRYISFRGIIIVPYHENFLDLNEAEWSILKKIGGPDAQISMFSKCGPFLLSWPFTGLRF